MLTDKRVKAAKPAEKPIRIWDRAGLYVEVSPSGAKLWRWKFRWQGREKRLALGIYPFVTLAEAREKAEDARRLLRRGQDPGALHQAQKAASSGEDTFEFIAREWHRKQSAQIVDAHAKRQLRRLELNVFPFVGARAPDDITTREWLEVLRKIEARGAIETAHRVRSICAQVYRFARACAKAEKDPLADLRGALKAAPPSHFAARTEPKELRPILLAIDGYKGTPVVRVALALQPLIFVRPGELRAMKWADVDLDANEWRFVASKTGTQLVVPLSRQARTLLEELQPLTGGGVYVFPSTRGSSRCMSDNTINAGLRRLGIDTKTEMTGHGWRAAARTILDEVLGFRPEVIEQQLGHAVRDPLGRAYNRTRHLDERHRMMQAWADFLDDVRTEKAA